MTPSREAFVCKWMPEVISSAKDNELDPLILMGLITVESNWNPKVVSDANACGMTQILPKYTGKITRKYTCAQLKNPKTSIRAGAKILRWWITYYKGDVDRGLCGYFAGFRCGKIPIKAGVRYAKKVRRQKTKILQAYQKVKLRNDKN